ncbi:hypothetical protein AYI70_g2070, partial [Smittium culicis]
KTTDNYDHHTDTKHEMPNNLSVKSELNPAISITNNQRKIDKSLKSAPIVICESSSEPEIPVSEAKVQDDSGSGKEFGSFNNNDGINSFVISADENEFISMPSVRTTRSQKASRIVAGSKTTSDYFKKATKIPGMGNKNSSLSKAVLEDSDDDSDGGGFSFSKFSAKR